MQRLAIAAGLLLSVLAKEAKPPTVRVPGLGSVFGSRTEAAGVEVEQFLGLQYGTAERWESPQMVSSWGRSPVNGTAFGPTCPGAGWLCDEVGQEQCLFLNVFRPSNGAKGCARSRRWKKDKMYGTKDGLPVVVFIHSGSFSTSCSNQLAGPSFVASAHNSGNDVIYVLMNYRLNIFGFFGGADLTAADGSIANSGIQDQRLALEWVKKNIAAFGGNPADVTLYGQSAGAASIGVHLVTEKSQGLYHKVIGMSGLFTTWSGQSLDAAEAKYQAALAATNCTTAACLKSLDASVLTAVAPTLPGSWAPTADGVEMAAHPRVLAQTGPLPSLPIVAGTTSDEASYFLAGVESIWDLSTDAFLYIVANDFLPDDENKEANLAKVAALYLDRSDYPADLGKFSLGWWAYMRVATDNWFTCSTNLALREMGKYTPSVYSYLFTHASQTNQTTWPETGPGSVTASHGAETFWWHNSSCLFDHCLFSTPAEQALASDMASWFAEFSATGELSAPWTLYDADIANVLSLDTSVASGGNGVFTREGFRTEHCAIWDPIQNAQVA